MRDAPERLRAALTDTYRIGRALGSGGMATVYLAEDVKHGREVAVKVLHPELAVAIGSDRFVREIEIAAKLTHPHILMLINSGEAEGFLYYVMPYVDGESLRDRLERDEKLSIAETVRITEQVASALNYAHDRGVIHRDIKPENILIHNGRPMVADFGIALAVSAAAGGRMTETGLSLGTPHYMSPEQATAEKDITHRSDIYSLGAMLYEMLVGEPPFTGPTAQSIVAKVITEKPPLATTQRDTVPRHVALAVYKALAKLPADRYPSAVAFGEALVRPQTADTDTYRLPTGESIVRPADGSSRLVMALAVLLAIATGAALWGWLRAAGSAQAPRVTFYHVPDSSHILAAICCGPIHAITRDGRRFAYVGAVRGRAQVFVREIDGLEARAVPGTRAASSLFFSPDGEWLGFVNGREQLMKVALAGGTPVLVAALRGAQYGATWTDENEIIFATGFGTGAGAGRNGLWSVPADGGTPRQITRPDSSNGEGGHRLPHFIPGHDAVVFTIWDTSNMLEDARVGFHRLGSARASAVSRGTHPQVTASSHLFAALPGGAIAAQRFDAGSGQVSEAVEYLADSVYISGGGGWSDYVVSWTGTMLYRTGVYAPTLEVVARDGTVRSLDVDIDAAAHLDSPRFAPTGPLLALSVSMTDGHRVHVIDLDRGTVLRVTLDGNTEHLAWTDDGDSIVMARDYARLVIQPADRSGAERVIVPEGTGANGVLQAGDQLTRVTVARRWLAVGRERTGLSADILAARLDIGDPTVYVATEFNEYAPALSPNARWLAYVSDETGRDEVYVSSFPQPGGRHTVSIDGGGEPVWGRDGRTLFYRDGNARLVVLAVEAGTEFAVLDRETLPMQAYELSPDGADYDVSPNGMEFVMLPSRSGSSRLVVVLNAGAER